MRILAINLLKRDKKGATFYLLFLVFFTAVTSFYMNLLVNDINALETFEQNILISLSYAVIVLSMILGFYAYQSFLASKTKLIAIFKLSGAGLLKMMSFLLIQSLSILLIAIPIGSSIGSIGAFLFYTYILAIEGFKLTFIAILMIVFILSVQIFYMAFVASGFIYRNEIISLMDYQNIVDEKRESIVNFRIPKHLSIVGFLICISLIFNAPANSSRYLAIGVFAIYLFCPGIIKKSLYSIIITIKKRFVITNSNLLVALSDSYIIIKDSIGFIQLSSCLIMLMVGCFTMFSYNHLVKIIVYSMYCISLTFLLIALLYQILMKINKFTCQFKQLRLIGYKAKDITTIIIYQIILSYVVISILVLIFPIISGTKLMNHGLLEASSLLFVIGSYLFEIILSASIVYIANRKELCKSYL